MSDRTSQRSIGLAFGTLFLAMLACGGFQVRVTPTPVPPTHTPAPTVTPLPTQTATIAPLRVATSATPTLALTSTATRPAAGIGSPAQARVTASGGLNVREQPTAKGKQLGRINFNVVVTLLEGPTTAEDFDWWKVDNGAGLVGWVAAGPKTEPWLVPIAEPTRPPQTPGVPNLVNRPIKVGDRVQVTTDTGQVLTVRDYAGKNSTPVARVVRGAVFTVVSGPIKQDGLVWWELNGETVKGWAAEGSGTDRWLTPLEP